MGQARLRGTFEQRKTEGVAKRLEDEQRLAEFARMEREARKEREANMTPEQRARAIKVRSLFAALTAIVAANEAQKADFANAVRNFTTG